MLSAALACHRARATTPLRRLPSSRSSRRHPHRDTAKDWRRRPRQWSPFCLVAVLESCTPQLAMSTIGTGLSRGEEGGAWAHCAGTSAAGWAVALLPAGPSGPVRATNHSSGSPADPLYDPTAAHSLRRPPSLQDTTAFPAARCIGVRSDVVKETYAHPPSRWRHAAPAANTSSIVAALQVTRDRRP